MLGSSLVIRLDLIRQYDDVGCIRTLWIMLLIIKQDWVQSFCSNMMQHLDLLLIYVTGFARTDIPIWLSLFTQFLYLNSGKCNTSQLILIL